MSLLVSQSQLLLAPPPSSPAYSRSIRGGGGILLNPLRPTVSAPLPSSRKSSAPASPAYTTSQLPSSGSSSDNDNAGGSSRRSIRFAPLPDPRRAVIVTEEGHELPAPFDENDSTIRCPEVLQLVASPTPSDAATPTATDIDDNDRDDTSSVATTSTAGKKSRSWSAKLLKPLFSLPKASGSKSTLPDDGGSLFRSTSRDSVGSSVSNGGDSGRATPSNRRISLGSAAGVNERRRMLNGRVYGAPRRNAFANIPDVEPEFVEWGYGGMGSVKGGAGDSKYSKVQSSSRVSSAADDDDDGSGMGWVKRRREERERKAREEKEAKEKAEAEAAAAKEKEEATAIAASESEKTITESDQVVEVPAEETTADAPPRSPVRNIPSIAVVPHTPPAQSQPATPRAASPSRPSLEHHHIYQAVTIPAPPRGRKDSTHSHHSVDKKKESSPETSPERSSGSATSTPEESEDETGVDVSESETEDEVEEIELDQDRKTSVCAGVEKFSKHH